MINRMLQHSKHARSSTGRTQLQGPVHLHLRPGFTTGPVKPGHVLTRQMVARALDKDQEQLIRQLAADVELPPSASSTSVGDASIATMTGPMQLQLPPGTVLSGKYEVTSVLGMGGSATTYQAVVHGSGQRVAVKALSLRAARDWKQLTLFQREAQTLESLNHPGIPKYLDYFEVDTPDDRAFYLVQEEVAGKSLAQMIQGGARCNLQEATRIAVSLCEILNYLSSLIPPVVHRDVKPENIVLEGGVWGGRVFLVDFGGVAAVASATDAASFASTVVGTYGYMAPEQFRGSAQPASDMYGLGATLLFLLSGKAPFAFPQERMRIQWRGSENGDGPSLSPPSSRWAALLDGLLEPVAEDRLTAQEALALLQGKEPAPSRTGGSRAVRRRGPPAAVVMPPMSPLDARLMQMQQNTNAQVTRQPPGSRVMCEHTPTRLDITIPPKGVFSGDTLMTGGFAIAWNAFVAVWTIGALSGGGILFALFSLPFWFAGVQLGKQAFGSALIKERFAIGRTKFRLGQELAMFNKSGQADFLGGNNEKVTQGSASDLRGARVVTIMFVNDQPQTAIEVLEGIRKHRFGEGLELEEQQWLVHEINSFLEGQQGRPLDYDSFPAPEMPRTVRDDDRFSST